MNAQQSKTQAEIKDEVSTFFKHYKIAIAERRKRFYNTLEEKRELDKKLKELWKEEHLLTQETKNEMFRIFTKLAELIGDAKYSITFFKNKHSLLYSLKNIKMNILLLLENSKTFDHWLLENTWKELGYEAHQAKRIVAAELEKEEQAVNPVIARIEDLMHYYALMNVFFSNFRKNNTSFDEGKKIYLQYLQKEQELLGLLEKEFLGGKEALDRAIIRYNNLISTPLGRAIVCTAAIPIVLLGDFFAIWASTGDPNVDDMPSLTLIFGTVAAFGAYKSFKEHFLQKKLKKVITIL